MSLGLVILIAVLMINILCSLSKCLHVCVFLFRLPDKMNKSLHPYSLFPQLHTCTIVHPPSSSIPPLCPLWPAPYSCSNKCVTACVRPVCCGKPRRVTSCDNKGKSLIYSSTPRHGESDEPEKISTTEQQVKCSRDYFLALHSLFTQY